jgi:hypothetical protein
MDPALIRRETSCLKLNPVWKCFKTRKVRLSCGYLVQQCDFSRSCTYRLPADICEGEDFKQHFLCDHSDFLGCKLVARATLGDPPPYEHCEFDGTDLDDQALLTYQYKSRQRAITTKGHRENFGYLEVFHLPLGLSCFVCSLCSFVGEDLFSVKSHTVSAHVAIYLDLLEPRATNYDRRVRTSLP